MPKARHRLAEPSALRWRRLAVFLLKARHFSKTKGESQFNQRRKSVQSKEKINSIEEKHGKKEGKAVDLLIKFNRQKKTQDYTLFIFKKVLLLLA